MSQQNEYKKLYLEEADQYLQEMNKNLLILEKDPADTQALNVIFRSAHTLKSSAASMGYQKTADLAHRMEDILDQIRRQAIKVNQGVIDLLFEAFDSLELMVKASSQDKDFSGDIQPLLDSFDKLLLNTSEFKKEEVQRDVAGFNDSERQALRRAEKEGFSIYVIHVTLDKNCVLKSARAFMVFRNLHTMGEVIKSIPDSRVIEEERFDLDFSCVFVTKEDKEVAREKVKEILDVKDVSIEEISVPQIEGGEILKGQSSDDHEHMRKIQSVRVDISRLDKLMNLVEELAIYKLRLMEVSSKSDNADFKGMAETLNRLTENLQNEVMQARLVPIGQIFDRFPRLVRDLAKKQGKLVKFEMNGLDIEVDRTILDEIGDPLIHLLRNAIDHAIEVPPERKRKGKPEEGKIILSARREKSHIFIDVEDDGEGMDAARIKKTAIERGLVTQESAEAMTDKQILFLSTMPGLSTKKEITDVSGRGVGLDVVKDKTQSLGGRVLIESMPAKGCKMTMQLPITTAVVQALLIQSAEEIFALPISSVEEILVMQESDVKRIEREETLLHRDHVLPLVRLDRLLPITGAHHLSSVSEPRTNAPSSRMNVVIVESNTKRFGIVVDKVVKQRDIVIKQLSKEFKGISGFAGATILGDGSVALVLDVATLV